MSLDPFPANHFLKHKWKKFFIFKCDLTWLEISWAGSKIEDALPWLVFPFRLCRCLTNDRVQPLPHATTRLWHHVAATLPSHNTQLQTHYVMELLPQRACLSLQRGTFPLFHPLRYKLCRWGQTHAHMNMCRYKIQPFTLSMSGTCAQKLLLYRGRVFNQLRCELIKHTLTCVQHDCGNARLRRWD